MKTYLSKEEFNIPEDYNVVNPREKSVYYGIPWITPEAAHYLNQILMGHENVLDIGIGGSTIFYGARCKSVLGLEIDTLGNWKPTITQAIEDQELKNVEVEFFSKEEELAEKILDLEDSFYDLISVDTYHLYNREIFLKNSRRKLTPKGILVLDNYREWYFGVISVCPDEQVLENLELPNHVVLNFDYLGWSGFGTRLIIPKELVIKKE